MNKLDELRKLTNYIEENTRAANNAGVTFIDTRRNKERIFLKQNHVIYGRRGAGKTSLINTLRNSDLETIIVAYSNLEDHKDISFPNVIYHVLSSLITQINASLKSESKWYQFGKKRRLSKIQKKLNKVLVQFKNEISKPDNYEEETTTKNVGKVDVNAKVGVWETTSTVGTSHSKEIQKKRTISQNKLQSIRNSILEIKEIIKAVASEVDNKPIFLILDDFYFLSKAIQPYFIDFFHRLTKDTNLFIKVGTIKHRTKLYTQNQSYIGTEVGGDIQEIDLDYTLDNFQELKSFMMSLFDKCCEESGTSLDMQSIFTENGFNQLCLASGGVPRDFLTLFVKTVNNLKSDVNISKTEVNETAIAHFKNKLDSLKVDTSDEKEILEHYLNYVKNFIINEKKTNVFLISNEDIENHSHVKQAILELVDLRTLHLIEKNTSSAPGDGKRYSAYIIDIGLYPNSRPRGFKQLEPGATDKKSRKDDIRSAPKLNLKKVEENLKQNGYQTKLELSSE